MFSPENSNIMLSDPRISKSNQASPVPISLGGEMFEKIKKLRHDDMRCECIINEDIDFEPGQFKVLSEVVSRLIPKKNPSNNAHNKLFSMSVHS